MEIPGFLAQYLLKEGLNWGIMQQSGLCPVQAETNERNETIVSASKERKQELELERQRQREEEAKAERKSMILYAVVGVVCAVAAVFLLVVNSGVLQRSAAAITINGTKFTAADMQYYYNMQYQNAATYAQTYAAYGLDFGFDYTADPADQIYDQTTGQTWEEFLMESAKDSAAYYVAVSDAANKAGHTLSEEALATKQSVLSNLETAWVGNATSRDAFIRASYGSYMTYDRLVELLDMELLAADYAAAVSDAADYTDEDYNTYYAENADTLDTFTITQFVVQAKEPTAAEGQELTDQEKLSGLEADKAAKKAIAKDILAKLEAGADAEALAEEYADDLYSSSVSATRLGSSLSSTSYADWALEDGRKVGDTTISEYQGSTVYNYYVVRYEGRELDNSKTADVRHMLIAAEKDDSVSVPNDEQFAAAEAKAQEILDGWKKGEATEDAFAALATEHSADTSSAAEGGLIAGVKSTDSYIQEFKDWALDPSRKPGDAGLVKNTGSAVMGWHVMYYVGDGMPYWKQLADTALRNADYAAWEAEVTQGYEAVEGFGMKLM